MKILLFLTLLFSSLLSHAEISFVTCNLFVTMDLEKEEFVKSIYEEALEREGKKEIVEYYEGTESPTLDFIGDDINQEVKQKLKENLDSELAFNPKEKLIADKWNIIKLDSQHYPKEHGYFLNLRTISKKGSRYNVKFAIDSEVESFNTGDELIHMGQFEYTGSLNPRHNANIIKALENGIKSLPPCTKMQ